MYLHRSLVLCLVLLFLIHPIPAAAESNPPPAPHLVKDMNACTVGSEPGDFYVVDEVVYFAANSMSTGKELWRSDGTDEGTALVQDLIPGADSSNPHNFYLAGSTLFFTAGGGASGQALWALDLGTNEARLVRDFGPETGAYGSDYEVYGFTQSGDRVFFIVQSTDSQYIKHPQLWVSDGTGLGTVQVAELSINPNPVYGAEDPDTVRLTVFKGQVYFMAWDAEHGDELWRSDGTGGGTGLFKDLLEDGDAHPSQIQVVGERLYLIASQVNEGYIVPGIWSSDGTPEATLPVPGAEPAHNSPLTLAGEVLFFTMYDGNNPSTELATMEVTLPAGTPGAVRRVEINPEGGSNPARFAGVGDQLLFVAHDGTHGEQIWRSDGTGAGTYQISNNDGFSILVHASSDRWLVFSHNTEFWATDGTVQGSVELSSLETLENYPFTQVVTSGGKIYSTSAVLCTGIEPLVTDIITGTTRLLKDIQVRTESASPRAAGDYAGKTVVFIEDANHALELWITDGTEAGTRRVYHFDIQSGNQGFDFYQANGLLFFSIKEWSEHRASLWQTDGTPEGTEKIDSAYIDAYWEEKPFQPAAYRDRIYFFSGSQLRSTNGEPGGSQVVKDFNEWMYYVGPVEMNGYLYFNVWLSDSLVYQLWRSDGTAAGTVLVKSMNQWPSSYSSWGFNMVSAGGKVFFIGRSEAHGDELWESDGTPAGTRMVADLAPGPSSPNYDSRLAVGDTLFFAIRADQDYKLWKTRGGSGGVQKVVDHLTSIYLTGTNGQYAYFTAPGQTAHLSVWRSDGTAAGTKELFVDNWGGQTYVYVGNRVYYTYNDPTYGVEIFVYNNSTETSTILADINPGPASSFPRPLGFVSGKLWLIGYDTLHGSELWMYDFLVERVYLPVVRR